MHAEAPLVEWLREAAARLPRGSWILRGDWGAYEQWRAGSAGAPPGDAATSAPPFTPDRRMIDGVTREHPVLISRFDGSMHLANSLALELAGIGEATAAPPGGEIAKDASGRLTGNLKGAAVDLVRKAIPPIPFEQRLAQVPTSGSGSKTRLRLTRRVQPGRRSRRTARAACARGCSPDVAVFDTDLVAAGRTNPRALLDAAVLYTIVGGEIVHSAPAARRPAR